MSFNRELFVKAGAHQMANTRPDLWTVEGAQKDLGRWLSELERWGKAGSAIGSGGFMLFWTVDDPETGEKEFYLVQSVADYCIFGNSGEESVFIWDTTGGDRIPAELVAVANEM